MATESKEIKINLTIVRRNVNEFNIDEDQNWFEKIAFFLEIHLFHKRQWKKKEKFNKKRNFTNFKQFHIYITFHEFEIWINFKRSRNFFS